MASFFARSSTTTQCQFCRFDPVGACSAISRHSSTTERSTGLSKSRRLRTDRVVVSSSSADRFSFMVRECCRHNGPMTDRVTIDIADGIANVRFNRPDKRNALDREQFAAIADAGERIKSTQGVRVVVLSGEGKSFCAGLDLAMFSSLGGGGETRGNPGSLTESGITHIGQQ